MQHQPPNPLDRIDTRMTSLEKDVSLILQSISGMTVALNRLVKIEDRLDAVEKDVRDLHKIVDQNKMVIDMIKWGVTLIVPAMLSVFGAIAWEMLVK